GLPEGRTAISLQPLDAALPALAPLYHALDRLQPMKVIACHSPIANGQGFLRRRTKRKLDRWNSPRYRQAGTALKREVQLVRNIDHLLRPVPVPRELFVVEVRDRAAAGAEDLCDLLEELVMRTHHDAVLAERVDAVLGHHHHSIHCELAGP